jgi:hypothetical protein
VIPSRVGQTYDHAFRALSPPSLLRLTSILRGLGFSARERLLNR